MHPALIPSMPSVVKDKLSVSKQFQFKEAGCLKNNPSDLPNQIKKHIYLISKCHISNNKCKIHVLRFSLQKIIIHFGFLHRVFPIRLKCSLDIDFFQNVH